MVIRCHWIYLNMGDTSNNIMALSANRRFSPNSVFFWGEKLINRWILGTQIFRQTQWNLWITGNSCCPTLVHFFLSGSMNSLWALFWELFWSCPWGPSKHHGNRRYKSRNWSCAIHQVAKKDVQCISASTSCNYLFSSQKQHFVCCRGPSKISHVLVCSIPTFKVFFWWVFPEVFQGRQSHLLSKYSCGDGLRPNYTICGGDEYSLKIHLPAIHLCI